MTDALIETPPGPVPRAARPPLGPPLAVDCPDCGHPVHQGMVCIVPRAWWRRLLWGRTICGCRRLG